MPPEGRQDKGEINIGSRLGFPSSSSYLTEYLIGQITVAAGGMLPSDVYTNRLFVTVRPPIRNGITLPAFVLINVRHRQSSGIFVDQRT